MRNSLSEFCKQRNTKDDTARKKTGTKSFTNSLKNRPRTEDFFVNLCI